MSKPWDGRPQNPERDGWHWLYHQEDLCLMVLPWSSERGGWVSDALHSPQGVVDLGFRYLGPALLPAEVDAAEHVPLPAADALARALEQVRAEEREACANSAHEAWENGCPPAEIAAAIRARGKEIAGD